MKDKVVAALLAFFLGSFGIHRFYLRQNGLGFLYVVFCWTGLPTIISIIDGILLIFRSEKDFNDKYNAGVVIQNENEVHASVASEIEKLFELKEKGAISEKEFLQRKGKLIKG